jgi:hypothetical protein
MTLRICRAASAALRNSNIEDKEAAVNWTARNWSDVTPECSSAGECTQEPAER